MILAPGFSKNEVLGLAASVERYSKHPLSGALIDGAEASGASLLDASEISEPPGEGLLGTVGGRSVQITSRQKILAQRPEPSETLPPISGGLECMVMIDGRYAATFRFRDQPREEGAPFIDHLGPRHHFQRVMIVFAEQTPEQKLEIVRTATAGSRTVYVGDGINDAPALTAATVGLAFGRDSDITAEAAGAVILENSLLKVDEFLHISSRMRTIALESAVGGMALSAVGIVAAAFGYLPPVAGAIAQEVIDVIAVLNALRVAIPPRVLSDFGGGQPGAPT